MVNFSKLRNAAGPRITSYGDDMRANIRVVLALLGLTLSGFAQWLNHPDPRTPRTKDGKADLTAPAPRLNGKPDLTGVWEAERTPPAIRGARACTLLSVFIGAILAIWIWR
jgi:hypothetical protein